MADKKYGTPKRMSLSETLNDISFKNEQIPFVENLKDRKRYGRNKSNSVKIQGLQTLRNTLGTQFTKK